MATANSENALAMIVGLGNPGAKYRQTRHNVGFDLLDMLKGRFGDPNLSAKFDGQFCRIEVGSRSVLLLWPLTYMNESGRSVAQAASFYKISVTNLLVVCDDLSLPLGKLRIRKSGSSGGQKGLADILKSLGTQEVPRLRIGINPPPSHWDVADYVLSKFSKDDRITIDQAIENACDAIQVWISRGIDASMNQFN